MKKLILSIAILVGLSVPAQSNMDLDSIIKSMKMIDSCGKKIEIQQKFLGCSKDIPLLVEMGKHGADHDGLAGVTDIAKMNIDREDPKFKRFLETFDEATFQVRLMPVVLDFMCVTPAGRTFMLDSMGMADTLGDGSDDTGATLMALAMFDGMFCKNPAMGGATLSAMVGQ